jgi:hypothetical protein
VKETEMIHKLAERVNVIHGHHGLNGPNVLFFAVVDRGTEQEAVQLTVVARD